MVIPWSCHDYFSWPEGSTTRWSSLAYHHGILVGFWGHHHRCSRFISTYCSNLIIDTPRTPAPAMFMSNMLYACRWTIFTFFRNWLLAFFTKSNPLYFGIQQDRCAHDFALEWMRDFEAFQAALASQWYTRCRGRAYVYDSLMNSMSLVLDEFNNNLKVCDCIFQTWHI